MQSRAAGSATLIVIILLGGIVFAAANVLMLTMTVKGAIEVPPLNAFYELCAPCVLYFISAPLVVSVLIAIMVQQSTARSNGSEPGAAAEPPVAAQPSSTPALRLLAVLQQEGRFIDFIAEDIDGYDDAQVGAAVRAIHAGCRKAINERITLARIYSADEGSEVAVEPGFDSNAVRLTGNVAGNPPFHGTLQHSGWRATNVTLPQSPGGVDPNIIAPAEVEIP